MSDLSKKDNGISTSSDSRGKKIFGKPNLKWFTQILTFGVISKNRFSTWFMNHTPRGYEGFSFFYVCVCFVEFCWRRKTKNNPQGSQGKFSLFGENFLSVFVGFSFAKVCFDDLLSVSPHVFSPDSSLGLFMS